MIAALPLIALAAAPAAAARLARGFGEADVRTLARDLWRRPYTPPATDLPPALTALDYDAYRDIRFDPGHALWKAEGLPFQLQFFHRGGLFRDRVDLYEIRDGRPVPIAYSPHQFVFKHGAPPGLPANLGFAGFRIHAPINRASYFDEVGVFLGATYFRAVAKGMLYGLSARGLALGVGAQEEFPAFRAFWIERPTVGARSLTVLALMDSPSCSGAFRFVITPGETTVFDTTASLFPRRSRSDVGIAPLTSMYLFGADGAGRFNDFRGQVHDSDGMAVAAADGERIWRPLANPPAIRAGTVADRQPRGFGLIQRERRLEAYRDLEARYDLRPSLWVEPLGAWGAGKVQLVELPAHTEYEDNIAAYWSPAEGLRAGVEARFAYRLHWGPEPSTGGLARVVHTRAEPGATAGPRRFAVDFDLPGDVTAKALTAQVRALPGAVSGVGVGLDSRSGRPGAQLSFALDPAGAPAAQVRAALLRSGKPCSEVWLYRWTA